jgi:Fe-S-cluster containining protein
MGMPPFLEHELSSLPAELREELEFIKMIDPERDEGGPPCIWLGEDKKCKHYQYRPHVCDDFEIGCESCLLYRLSR